MGTKIVSQFVGRTSATEKLYRLEEAAQHQVRKVAEELLRLKVAAGLVETDLYRDAIPQTIAMLCDAFASDLEVHRVS